MNTLLKYNLSLKLSLSFILVAGVGCARKAEDSDSVGSSSCRAQVCGDIYYVVRSFKDCSGVEVRKDNWAHDGSEVMIRVESARNVAIDKGEITNLKSGKKIRNHDEWGGNRQYHKQSYWVSLWDRPNTLQVDRGSNAIEYNYYALSNDGLRYDVVERGNRTITAAGRGMVNATCDMIPTCSNGAVTGYSSCSNWTVLTTPYAIWSDW